MAAMGQEMTLDEFLKLETDDRVVNPMTNSTGRVTDVVKNQGVRVQWGEVEGGAFNGFFFSINSTAWKHWSVEKRPTSAVEASKFKQQPTGAEDLRHQDGMDEDNQRGAS